MALKPPTELGKSGRALWNKVVGPSSPEAKRLVLEDPRESISLRQACLLEDDLARLRAELGDSALVVKGSTGQPVETPLLGAIRNAVALQAKLLGSIAIDVSDEARARAGRALALQRRSHG